MKHIRYAIPGILFGIVLIKAQVVSWFRIQEMFRFQSFHMYGIIGSAILTAMLAQWLIRKSHAKTMEGEAITVPDKKFHWGNVYGGLIFGVGWAITGACPGPLFALIGAGFPAIILTLLSALAGTWVYGLIRERLPH